MGFLDLIPGLFKLADQFIEDKDLKAKLYVDTMNKMLDTKTYPWIDALVKLSYASEQIIKGLFRPLMAGCMAAFAMYCEVKGIQLSDTVQTMLYGAPVAWGVSRHAEKQKKGAKGPKMEDGDYDG